jgi:hypothetical protein
VDVCESVCCLSEGAAGHNRRGVGIGRERVGNRIDLSKTFHGNCGVSNLVNFAAVQLIKVISLFLQGEAVPWN